MSSKKTISPTVSSQMLDYPVIHQEWMPGLLEASPRFKQHPYLTVTLQTQPEMLDHTTQVGEQLAVQPKSVAEPSLVGVLFKKNLWGSLSKIAYPDGECCLPNPKSSTKHCASFWVVGGANCKNLFILEGLSPTCPIQQNPQKDHWGRGPWNCQIYIPSCDIQVSYQ